jgi:hypothetical protein
MNSSAETAVVLGPSFWAWRGLGFLASTAAVTALLTLVAH